MDSPLISSFGRRAFRFGLIVVFGFVAGLSAQARESPRSTLLDSFLEVDARFLEAAQIAAARTAFEALVHQASPCGAAATPRQDRARCVVGSLFASDQLVTVAEPGDPESSTVTSALVSHRGNCAALTALVLAVAVRVNVPMDAVVFPKHVVVRARGEDDRVFELLSRGSMLSMSQIRRQLGFDGAHDTRVRPNAFPTYYVDNLAVRFADAEDTDRAEAMFEKAIEAGPRVARVRFNYGTYLLAANRLELAREQLNRAVRLDRDNASAWANLGVVFARLENTSEARRCFEKALKIDPRNAPARGNLDALTSGSVGRTPPHQR